MTSAVSPARPEGGATPTLGTFIGVFTPSILTILGVILINWLAAVVAVIVEFGLYLGLERRSLSASWGDLRFGALMSLVRSTALRLRALPPAPRNWRPHLLVFAGDVDRRIDRCP